MQFLQRIITEHIMARDLQSKLVILMLFNNWNIHQAVMGAMTLGGTKCDSL
jgi:hypothetical protein